MQTLQQIRDEEKKGEKIVAAAKEEAARILDEARAKEEKVRGKVARDMDEREELLAEQTLDEAKKILAGARKDTDSQVVILQQQAKENSTAAVKFISSLLLDKAA